MGEYTVSPQATINTDINSWATNYTSDIQYSVSAGPFSGVSSNTTTVLLSGMPTIPALQGATNTLVTGWSTAQPANRYPAGSVDSPLVDGGWINAGSGNSVTYTLTVATGKSTSIIYGIPAGGYADNAPWSVSLNGALQISSSSDVAPYGYRTPSTEQLRITTLTAGNYTITIQGSGFNVYGLWASNPSAITSG
jgi:hypothetical protein